MHISESTGSFFNDFARKERFEGEFIVWFMMELFLIYRSYMEYWNNANYLSEFEYLLSIMLMKVI